MRDAPGRELQKPGRNGQKLCVCYWEEHGILERVLGWVGLFVVG